ncbi:MAG: BACON domain-containing protein [Nitrospira sp.]|nr:BACON domain-containing protein [Nitrospira sp.]
MISTYGSAHYLLSLIIYWAINASVHHETTRKFPMPRLRSIVPLIAIAILTCDVAWGATLTWSPNTEPDLAGYRVYQCTSQPCGRAQGTATLLVTLGAVTSFNIGTPGSTHYYIITAYDTANNESADSGVAIYSPPNSPPPPPAAPAIGAMPRTLSFAMQQGGADPPSQLLTISNVGGGTLTWTASDNTSWLSLTPGSGTGNGTATVQVMAGNRAAGTYNGTITVSATGASNVLVPATLTITTAPIAPPPTPTGLQFSSQ